MLRHHHDRTTSFTKASREQLERLKAAAVNQLEQHGSETAEDEGSPHLKYEEGEITLSLYLRVYFMPRLERGELGFSPNKSIDEWIDLHVHFRGRHVLHLEIHSCGQYFPSRFRRGPWEQLLLGHDHSRPQLCENTTPIKKPS